MIKQITIDEAKKITAETDKKKAVMQLGQDLFDVREASDSEIDDFIRTWQMSKKREEL